MLEYDADDRLVWDQWLLSTSRQVGKSYLLRILAMWRLDQAEWFGEEQLVLHTGKDLPVCREVQRPARTWARRHKHDGFGAREVNGQEEVSAPDGSRWIIRGRDSVYGYSASLAFVDEAWCVGVTVVDEGLEPTMTEREQSQLGLISTAHRRSTSLFPSRRSLALDHVDDPEDVLILEWSAPPGSALGDEAAWRAASPHWSDRRATLMRAKLDRAVAGEADPEDGDEDPLESFRSQWLNDWSVERQARLSGRDEPLTNAETWAGALDLNANVIPGCPVAISCEDNYGNGAAVAFACQLPDGRTLVSGSTFARRSQAAIQAVELASRYPGARLCLPASLRAAEGFPRPPLVDAVVDVGTPAMRDGLPLVRELLGEGRLVHDGGDDLAGQVIAALVVPASTGLAVSPRSPRADLLRAAVFAVHDVMRAPVVFEPPAIF
jgi:hypothetical protein